ncbi:MAG: sensor histidine kinase [Gammaproteobacteria bacterium]
MENGPKQRSPRVFSRVCAGALIALGSAVLAGWAFDVPALKSVWAGLATMKVNTAVCFVLAGLALALASIPDPHAARRAVQGCSALLLLLAALTLVERLSGLGLGLDEMLFPDADTPKQLYPGRMSTATGIGFLLAAATLLLGPWVCRFPRLGLVVRGLSLGVLAIGALGLLGYTLDFELLYGRYAYSTVALHTAAGLLALGAGLWFSGQAGGWPRRAVSDHARITRLAGSCLMLAAGCTGIVGFTALETQVEDTLAGGLGSALTAHLVQIATTLELRTTRAAIIGTRPDLLKHLRLLAQNPGNGEHRRVVQGEIESFRPHGFSGIVLRLPDGAKVAQLGKLVATPVLGVPVDVGTAASLLWQEGLYLRHRLPLRDASGPLGTMVAEQFLPNTTKALLGGKAFGESTELLLCRSEAHLFRCFPTHLAPKPLSLPPRASGSPLFLQRAIEQGAGFGSTVDYRGKRVLGAYAPVGTFGLLAVLKVDAEEIYRPIGRQFQLALLLVALLTAGGTLLVRVRVRPLARALEERVRERTAALTASEERLRVLNEQLEARVEQRTADLTAANQELEAFSYSVSHDLRAPLRHIHGFSDLLRRQHEANLDEEGRRYLSKISDSAQQMGVLIDELLTFSRIGRAELKRTGVDLRELVGEVRDLLQPEMGGRDIVWALGELPQVPADRHLLRLVLQNLISNALKYSGTRQRAEISMSTSRESGEFVVSIRDNGVGFDMKYADRLFGVFQRLHSDFEGTGIGLATVQRIVLRHGGRVWAEGAVDKGACFFFSLPQELPVLSE